MDNKKVIIIGAGIAGISAAVNLASNGFEVQVYEARGFPGGRTYSFKDKVTGELIDNGQHLMMGAYQYFLKLLDTLGTSNKTLSYPGIKIPFIENSGEHYFFNTQLLPGRAGMLLGMLNLRSVSLRARINAVDFLISLGFGSKKYNYQNVHELLRGNKQTPHIIRNFWEPLCLAVMNTRTEIADANLFINVLRKAFFSKAQASRLIFPVYGLSELIQPFQDYIKSKGGSINYSTRVDEIIGNDNRISGIRVGGDIKVADYYISAVPPFVLNRIFNDNFITKELDLFEYSSIISCYLWINKSITDFDLCALLGSKVQWIFNRRKIFRSEKSLIEKYPGHIALTLSGANEFNNIPNEQLLNIFLSDLHKCLPNSRNAEIFHSVIIKDKYATFRADKTLSSLRPDQKTSIPGFYICGDWTATGLPATIESASMSGYLASDNIIKKN